MKISSIFFLLALNWVQILSQNKRADADVEELVVDEVVEDATKQNILIDQNYNSSFTVSIPMLSVLVPGTSRATGIVRFSMSQITLWILASIATIALVFPVIIGPHGRLNSRDFVGRSSSNADFLDHLESIVNVSQIFEDLKSVVPERATKQCLRKTICEAHEHAEHFGIAGMTLRSAYPARDFNVFGSGVEEDFRKAAEYGTFSEFSCEQIYSDCAISPLEVYQEATNYLMANYIDVADLAS